MAFQKGQSGNPGGRPKIDPVLTDTARAHTKDAIETLVSVMNDQKNTPSSRVSAANALLDRGHGKAQAHIDVSVDDDLRERSEEEIDNHLDQLCREMGVKMIPHDYEKEGNQIDDGCTT